MREIDLCWNRIASWACFHPFFSRGFRLWSWIWCLKWSHQVVYWRNTPYGCRQRWLFCSKWGLWVKNSLIWYLWCIPKRLHYFVFQSLPNCALLCWLPQRTHKLWVQIRVVANKVSGNDLQRDLIGLQAKCWTFWKLFIYAFLPSWKESKSKISKHGVENLCLWLRKLAWLALLTHSRFCLQFGHRLEFFEFGKLYEDFWFSSKRY